MAAEWADYLASKETLKYNDVKYKNEYVGENILRIKMNNKFYFSGNIINKSYYFFRILSNILFKAKRSLMNGTKVSKNINIMVNLM